jgi:DNA polymerase elongation subunit (family B)
LFNVDVRFSQRYAMEHGIFPMGLVRYANSTWTAEEEHFALDYPLPPLKQSFLDLRVDQPLGIPRMTDRLLGAKVDDDEINGDEETILRGIEEIVHSKNPDILLTEDGDSFAMPYLARKATEHGLDLQLGRDPQPFRERQGKSYFTYGKIVYKPGQYLLRGRLHLDRGHFAYRESDLAGLAELSRLSTLTPQEQARLTPGTAFTAMQVVQAHHDGCLALWKKNRPEEFKTAEYLLRGDRGGFIFEPEVGLHEGLYELDFSSLYPNIMVKYNISPETLGCRCCEFDGRSVPELTYHLCARRVGLIPRVLKPIIERRRYYKKMKREPGPLEEVYRDRDAILKWLLVTAFSVTPDTAMRASAASSATRRSTPTRGKSSCTRWKSRNPIATRSSTASSIPCGSGPSPARTTFMWSKSTSRAPRASPSSSKAATSGSSSSRARPRAWAR